MEMMAVVDDGNKYRKIDGYGYRDGNSYDNDIVLGDLGDSKVNTTIIIIGGGGRSNCSTRLQKREKGKNRSTD